MRLGKAQVFLGSELLVLTLDCLSLSSQLVLTYIILDLLNITKSHLSHCSDLCTRSVALYITTPQMYKFIPSKLYALEDRICLEVREKLLTSSLEFQNRIEALHQSHSVVLVRVSPARVVGL